jgi:hypothetical protein
LFVFTTPFIWFFYLILYVVIPASILLVVFQCISLFLFLSNHAHMGEERGVYWVLVGRPESKRPLGRPRRSRDDNIKMDLGEIGIDGANWSRLAQNRFQWWAFLNMVINLQVP